MPANNSSAIVHYWAGKYPGKLGWLVGPEHFRKCKFRPWMPYACDNDAYTAFIKQKPWNEPQFFALLDFCRMQPDKPIWVAVPDVVGNQEETLLNWQLYAPRVAEYGWPLAFVVQDGMTPGDVPSNAAIVFVGGSTTWKWRTVKLWASNFPRVHVGRVNEGDKLWLCDDLGVESVDGTGWFRGTTEGRQARALGRYLERDRQPQEEMTL